MIRVVYGNNFLKSLKKLPENVQRKAGSLIPVLRANPLHPLLHTKKLTGPLTGFLSFRITRDYRVIFHFLDASAVQLLRAEHRKDIYR